MVFFFTGAIALAEFLAESPRIIRLDLRNNNIRVGGLMALTLAFKINYSLLRLDIDKPNSKEPVSSAKHDFLKSQYAEFSPFCAPAFCQLKLFRFQFAFIVHSTT